MSFQIPAYDLYTSMPQKELLFLLRQWVLDKRGLYRESPGDLASLLQNPRWDSLALAALAVLNPHAETEEGRTIALFDYLLNPHNPIPSVWKIPSRQIAGSAVFSIPWDQRDKVDIIGALCCSGDKDGWESGEIVLASSKGFLKIEGLAEARNRGDFKDGETLQDYIMSMDLFQGNLLMNFKAGLLAAQLFSLAFH